MVELNAWKGGDQRRLSAGPKYESRRWIATVIKGEEREERLAVGDDGGTKEAWPPLEPSYSYSYGSVQSSVSLTFRPGSKWPCVCARVCVCGQSKQRAAV